MRALVSADWQLQNFSEFSSLVGEGYNRRLVEFLDGMTAILERERPEVLIVAGDVFQNKAALETDLIHYVHTRFHEWRTRGLVEEIILLLGNHDTAMLSAAIHSLSQFQAFCTVITEAMVYRGIAWSPWRPTLAEIEEDLNRLAESEEADILIGHWTVRGASAGSATMETGVDPAMPALGRFRQVLLGDIHQSQRIDPNILYLGSPAQQNFGEEFNTNAVWLLDIERDTLDEIPTSFPKFKTVSSVAEAEAKRAAGYFVRIRAQSREEMALGNAEGFRVEQDFTESVASEARGIVNNVTEAVVAYAMTNGREDRVEAGLGFLERALASRTVPTVEVRLETLHAENFLSYRALDLDFRERRGLIVIHGEVIADQAYDSNGAGKTALYEALYYGLYGVTLRYGVRRDATIRDGEVRNRVRLELSVVRPAGPPDALVIDRPRPGVLRLTLNGKDITASEAAVTQRKITELVGDPAFFLRVSFLGLHYHPSFLRLSDPDKKKFIDQFSGLDVFTSARELANDEVKRLDLDARRLEVEENRYDERRTLVEASLGDAENRLAAFRERERKLTEERLAEVAELQHDRAALVKPEPLLYPVFITPKLREPIPPKTPDPEPIRSRIAESEAALEEVRPALAELRESQHARLQPLFSKEESLQSEIETLHNSKEREVCPLCNRRFENAEEHNRHVAGKIAELSREAATAHRNTVDLQKQLDEELAGFKQEISDIEHGVKADRIALAEISEKQAKYERETNAYLNATQKAAISHKEACNEIDRRNAAAQQQYDLQIQRINDHLLSLEKIRPAEPTEILAQIEGLRADFAEVKEKIGGLGARNEALLKARADLEFWVAGFGNSGCKSLLYTNLIDSLNRELAEICNVISGGALRLRLLPYAETARGDTIEKISLEAINYLGADVFDGDSLGEQNRIDIAVACALRRVLKTFSGYSSNVLFIDEPFTGLDRSGKTAVYALLKMEAERCLVLVTDQEKATKGETDAAVWTVTKANRVSTLRNV